MKRIFSILVLLSFSSMIFSQQKIQFLDMNFEQIKTKAKKEKKLIFVDAYAVWCGPCRMMDKNIFTAKSVSEYFNANFINAKIDMEKGEGITFARNYDVTSYPSLFILNADGEVVSKSLGYMNEKQFLEFGKEANKPANKEGSIKERFEKGENNKDFLLNIVKTNITSDYPFAKKASERYFENKKDKEFNEEELNMLLYFTKSTKDPNFKIIQGNKEIIEKYLQPQVYQQFVTHIMLSEVTENAVDRENKSIKEDYFLTEATKVVGEKEAKNALNRLKLNFYFSTKNFEGYEKAALEYYQNPQDFSADELNRAAQIVGLSTNNPESIKAAIAWAENVSQRQASVTNAYVLSLLYKKSGNIEKAKIFAVSAIELAKQSGQDYQELQKYYDELSK